jgi:hypothetical protein
VPSGLPLHTRRCCHRCCRAECCCCLRLPLLPPLLPLLPDPPHLITSCRPSPLSPSSADLTPPCRHVGVGGSCAGLGLGGWPIDSGLAGNLGDLWTLPVEDAPVQAGRGWFVGGLAGWRMDAQPRQHSADSAPKPTDQQRASTCRVVALSQGANMPPSARHVSNIAPVCLRGRCCGARRAAASCRLCPQIPAPRFSGPSALGPASNSRPWVLSPCLGPHPGFLEP